MDLTNVSKNNTTLVNVIKQDQRFPAIAGIAVAGASIAGDETYSIATVLTNIAKNSAASLANITANSAALTNLSKNSATLTNATKS